MGIYDSGIDFDISPGSKKIAVYALIAIAAIAIIAVLAMAAAEYAKPQALSFRFEKNPIKQDQMTTLYVTVTNISGFDLANVPIDVRAKEGAELQISASSEKFNGTAVSLPQLSGGTSREVAFTINPVGKILPGTYVIVAKTTINSEPFEEEAILKVEE